LTANQVENFGDRLVKAVLAKQSQVCVGLDPRLESLPPALVERHRVQAKGKGCGRREVAGLFEDFCQDIISAVAPYAVAVKLQLACFERYGPPGMRAFKHLCRRAAAAGLVVIADAKRGDIGVSAQAYSAAFIGMSAGLEGAIGGYGADAMTVNPLFGTDGVQPFVDDCSCYGRGIFVLLKTSNPGADELQGFPEGGGQTLSGRIAELVGAWGRDLVGEEGYSSVGAVVGATRPETIAGIRKDLPASFFLLPGYGAQGAGAADVAQAFDKRGLGALVTASRSIIYAGKDEDYAAAAAVAARKMRDELWLLSTGGKPRDL
jgi:orotidine-5'-phosphate decarboxylase